MRVSSSEAAKQLLASALVFISDPIGPSTKTSVFIATQISASGLASVTCTIRMFLAHFGITIA